MRKVFLGLGSSIGAMLSGILSFPHDNLPNVFASGGAALSTTPRRAAPRRIKRRPGATHRGWTPNYYGTAKAESQEAARRKRNGMHHQQKWSHKDGTVQPRHIFGDAP